MASLEELEGGYTPQRRYYKIDGKGRLQFDSWAIFTRHLQ